MTADLWVKGSVTDTGTLRISYSGALNCTSSPIRIDGNLGGTLDIPTLCGNDTIYGAAGHIIVNGSFENEGRIHLSGPLGTGAFVAIGYDGWDGDTWDPNAVIILGDPNDPNNVYHGNTPARHLWEITACRADMNNDGTVGFGDINPFILALSSSAGYATAWPGLAGSMVYHGDANCDGTLSFADINPFVALVSAGTCTSCAGENGMNRVNWMNEGNEDDAGAQSPEQLATILGANVAPELYDDLLALIGEAAGQQDSDEGAAYWEAVYYALTE